MTALFGWCAECGQLVGRDCCWGPDRSCARCARARAASGNADGGFALLGAARAAVRQLDGTSAQFSSVMATIASTEAVGPSALVAWKDSWLAAGVLRARIDGSTDAARSWLRALPPSEVDRASELYEELLTVEASLEARWQSLESALSVAGERLARRPGIRRRAVAATVAEPPAVPVAAIAVAVPIPIGEPDRAVIRVRPSVPAPSPPQPVAVSIRAPRPPPPVRATEIAAVSTPTRSLPPTQGVRRPVTPTTPREEVTAAPAAAPARAEGPGRIASLLVAVVVLALAAGILAVARLAGTDANGTPDPARVIDPDADGTATAGIASSTSPSPADAPASPPTVISVDQHRIGPLDPGELPITRVIGAPEVEAFPSPFDRSLRLAGTSAGVCVASASSPGASSLGFELHLGELGVGGGRLVVAFPGREPVLALDLAALAGLDRGAWYRLAVTADEGTGRAVVTAVADDRSVLEIELEAAADMATAAVGEACLSAEFRASDASVFVDNLRVDA